MWKPLKKKLIHFPWCNWHTRFMHETSQNYRPVCVCEHPRICMSHIYVNLVNIPSLRAFSWKLTFPLCLWEEIGCLINCLNVSQSLNTSDRMCSKALKKNKKRKTLNIRSCCIPYVKWMQLPWQQHTADDSVIFCLNDPD